MENVLSSISNERLAEFCRLTFQSEARVGFLTLEGVKRGLKELFGRRVDLVPKGGLKLMIRDSVLATSRVLYAA